MSNSKYSSNAVYKKAHDLRKQGGLKVVKAAWDGLNTAKTQDAAKTAFKAITWHHRHSSSVEAPELLQQLVQAFATLTARQTGLDVCDEWLDSLISDVPTNWTAQYPLFRPAASNEA